MTGVPAKGANPAKARKRPEIIDTETRQPYQPPPPPPPKVLEIPERDAFYARVAINKALQSYTDELDYLKAAYERPGEPVDGFTWQRSIYGLHSHQTQLVKELLECVERWPEDLRPHHTVVEAARAAAVYMRSNPND